MYLRKSKTDQLHRIDFELWDQGASSLANGCFSFNFDLRSSASNGQFRPLLVTFHRLKAAVDDPLYCPGLLFIDIETGLIFSKIKSNI